MAPTPSAPLDGGDAAAARQILSAHGLAVEIPTRAGVVRPVDGVSFDIAAGETLGVVGESGAGESMTGAAVIGLIDPPGRIAGGAVLLEGHPGAGRAGLPVHQPRSERRALHG